MQIIITNLSTFTTNYDRKLLQITAHLLQTAAKKYYKLHQKFVTNYAGSNFLKLLVIITNCVNFCD